MYAETRNMTPYGGGEFDNGESRSAIANKTQNFEVVAQYQFDFGLRPSIAYLQSKGKDLGGWAHDGNGDPRYTNKDLVKYVDIGATYYFNKTCPPMLITKSTCWTTTMTSTKQTASLPMISLLWA